MAQDLEEIAGSKAGKMSEEMRFVIELQKSLLKCKTPGDVELVFNKGEEIMGSQIRFVDRIGLLVQSVLMLDGDQRESYNAAVDFFVQVAKNAETK